MTIRKDGSVRHEGGKEDTKANPHKRLMPDGSLQGHKNVRITGPDLKHAKAILKEHFPKTEEKAHANIEAQERDQRNGEWIRFNDEMKVRLGPDAATAALHHLNRTKPRGAPATRPTFQMTAYFKTRENGKRELVYPGDPDY